MSESYLVPPYLEPLIVSSDFVDWSLLKTSINRIKMGVIIIWPFVVMILVISYLIYYVLSYFYELKRQYNCFSLINFFNGNIFKCFNDPPEYCKDVNNDLYWGWCMDQDYYGAYPGDIYGPYGITCNHWISNPKKCPPIKCQGNYPIGIHIDSKNDHIQEYGWCVDPEINRALKGTYCGPSIEEGVKCNNWIWEESKCPKTCPINVLNQETMKPQSNIKVTTKTRSNIKLPTKPQSNIKFPTTKVVKKDCSLICGLKNGKHIPCPPPDCADSGSCQC